jgi:hypothetical protein
MNKAIAIYEFRLAKKPDGTLLKEKYILTERRGEDVLQLGACKRGADEGKEYIMLSPTQKNKPGGRQWTHSLYTTNAEALDKKKLAGGGEPTKVRITGLNFHKEHCGKTQGETHSPFLARQNDALLIENSPDRERLKIAVFAEARINAHAIFEAWLAGEVPDVAEGDAAPLPQGTA